ncbi:DUF6338 family protein [Saccharothrix syringae]|uniref:Uncharacterized protein n=1 Tax=Saccharothrix syringae TaxID=103733 RepID=A0A5Q0GX22_SACSY|nr:DUF6338 family protein [Saccharothrix syringae]QFZ18498.1 hypothetical protein EKG83_14340 [Saccharothrix syringae]
MPTTLTSLLIFATLLLPGLVFVRRTERDSPERELSAFRETVAVVAAGLCSDLVLLVGLVGAGLAVPRAAPDVGSFLRNPIDHLAEVVLWSVGFVATACVLAHLSAVVLACRAARHPSARRLSDTQQSAWWLLFREHPDAQVFVGCTLEDGSYLAGFLHSYSRTAKEHPDRELTLRGDITHRPASSTTAAVLPDVNAVAISARRIQFLTVTYLVTDGEDDQPAP